MTLGELLGTRVRDEDGRRLGHVHDVRAELRDDREVVTGLVVGRHGALERLGLGAPRAWPRPRSRDVVPWRDVVRVTRAGVVVRRPPA